MDKSIPPVIIQRGRFFLTFCCPLHLLCVGAVATAFGLGKVSAAPLQIFVVHAVCERGSHLQVGQAGKEEAWRGQMVVKGSFFVNLFPSHFLHVISSLKSVCVDEAHHSPKMLLFARPYPYLAVDNHAPPKCVAISVPTLSTARSSRHESVRFKSVQVVVTVSSSRDHP